MKFLCIGDVHLSEKTPENRTDNYPNTQYEKIIWILGLAVKNKCDALLQPGDLFDNFLVSDRLKRRYIELFSEYKIPIFMVPGQHDLRYHNSEIENTPVGILDAAKVIHIVSEPIEIGNVAIYGAGWEKEVPKIQNKNKFNILITHRMIINDEKIWFGQKEYTLSNHLLKKSGFDLIVSGDNHTSFLLEDKKTNTKLINCGSLMRARADQLNHKPICYIVDSDSNILEKFSIPINDYKSVLCVDKVDEEKERNEKLEEYIEELNSDVEIAGLDFKKNMIVFLKENCIESGVSELISECLK